MHCKSPQNHIISAKTRNFKVRKCVRLFKVSSVTEKLCTNCESVAWLTNCGLQSSLPLKEFILYSFAVNWTIGSQDK